MAWPDGAQALSGSSIRDDPRSPRRLLAGKFGRDPDTRHRNNVLRAIEFIDANLGEHLPLARIAGEAKLSPFHFAHVFKRLVGVAPHQYVMAQRLERAEALLTHSDWPIATIALELGYANQSHFSKAFHRLAGMTPLSCRLRR